MFQPAAETRDTAASNARGERVNKLSTCLLAALALLLAGCAGNPRLPSELDLSQASIAAGSSETTLSLAGPSGKGMGAGQGAAKGGGIGLLIGSLACMGTGFLAPLCISTVVPTTTAIGAVSGGVRGAVIAESSDEVEARRHMLQAELEAPATRTRLATQLQQKSRAALAVELPLLDPDAQAARREWTLQVTLTELSTVGSRAGLPYGLHTWASLEVARAGDSQPLFVKHYRAYSIEKYTTAEWQSNDAEPVRIALDRMSAALATKMVSDLKQTKR
jgi:hypothetical protein